MAWRVMSPDVSFLAALDGAFRRLHAPYRLHAPGEPCSLAHDDGAGLVGAVGVEAECDGAGGGLDGGVELGRGLDRELVDVGDEGAGLQARRIGPGSGTLKFPDPTGLQVRRCNCPLRPNGPSDASPGQATIGSAALGS